MATIFTKIINREIPAHIVAEDEHHIALLDVKPVKRGHTLVVPKREVDYIFDLPDEELARLHIFSKKVAAALRKAVPCKRIGTAVVGLEVPHVHIHLIPMDSIDDLSFTRERLSFSDAEYAKIREEIANKLK